MSARQRVPLTGRSNLSDVGASTGRESVGSETRRRLNDPRIVLRPYSAQGEVRDVHLTRPPILPKSRFKLVPEADPTLGVPKRGRGRHATLICPDGWIERNLEPNWFETIDQSSALFDIEAKTHLCRDFVERNQLQLWKYSIDYLNKTPRTVADSIIDHPGFVKLMSNMHEKERKLKLSNSERVRRAMRDDHLQTTKTTVKSDVYLQSLETSREARTDKMNYLLSSSSTINPELPFRRGYNHAPEYGNFSQFNGLLQTNKGAMLNR